VTLELFNRLSEIRNRIEAINTTIAEWEWATDVSVRLPGLIDYPRMLLLPEYEQKTKELVDRVRIDALVWLKNRKAELEAEFERL